MGGRVITSKAANFLVEDAALRDRAVGPVFELLDISLKPVELVLAGFRRQYGGLWVGGRVELSETAVSLTPNVLNRAFHQQLSSIEVPLDLLTSVEVLPGFVTKIIALGTPTHVVKLRCYGAPTLADQIRAQRP